MVKPKEALTLQRFPIAVYLMLMVAGELGWKCWVVFVGTFHAVSRESCIGLGPTLIKWLDYVEYKPYPKIPTSWEFPGNQYVCDEKLLWTITNFKLDRVVNATPR